MAHRDTLQMQQHKGNTILDLIALVDRAGLHYADAPTDAYGNVDWLRAKLELGREHGLVAEQ